MTEEQSQIEDVAHRLLCESWVSADFDDPELGMVGKMFEIVEDICDPDILHEENLIGKIRSAMERIDDDFNINNQ